MEQEIKELVDQLKKQVQKCSKIDELDQLHQQYLGKKGIFTSKLKQISSLPQQERAAVGGQLNRAKQEINGMFAAERQKLQTKQFDAQLDQDWIDVTVPTANSYGSLNPISMVQARAEEIFSAMGFEIMDGPHIESSYYNFEALNFPPDHPAKDQQDTFYLEGDMLLRTQTSSIQIRALETRKPPFKVVGPGKVFRAERIDASHSSVFHQLEGMMTDKDISVANLIHFCQTLLNELYEDNVKIRIRPGYFPFVEPGLEIDMACLFCKSRGCPACQQAGWLEVLGCGLTHPNVLKAGDVDTKKYSAFAFGMGLDRLAMLKYGINDIRLLHGGNIDRVQNFSIPK